VWLTDIAGLSRKEAVQLMRWTAGALLRAALADGGAIGLQSRRAGTVRRGSRRLGSSRPSS
jgi:hypothetical protein